MLPLYPPTGALLFQWGTSSHYPPTHFSLIMLSPAQDPSVSFSDFKLIYSCPTLGYKALYFLILDAITTSLHSIIPHCSNHIFVYSSNTLTISISGSLCFIPTARKSSVPASLGICIFSFRLLFTHHVIRETIPDFPS